MLLHPKISQSLIIIQLLTHFTKSILKSLINQLCDISRCNTQSILSKNFIVKQFKNSTHKILIFSRVEKMVWVVLSPPLIFKADGDIKQLNDFIVIYKLVSWPVSFSISVNFESVKILLWIINETIKYNSILQNYECPISKCIAYII